MNLTKTEGRIVVVGGNGALGRALIDQIKSLSPSKNYIIHSVDLAANPQATHNHLLSPHQLTDPNHLNSLIEEVKGSAAGGNNEANNQSAFKGIFCVAGGWEGGAIDSPNLMSSIIKMWEMNVISASLSAALCPNLEQNGLVVLVGAKAALKGTPGMLGYGMAKAAINHLARSLATDDRLKEASVVTILPETLDTEANRKAMPKADFSSWTPLSEVAILLVNWLDEESSRPTTNVGNPVFLAITTRKHQTGYQKVQVHDA